MEDKVAWWEHFVDKTPSRVQPLKPLTYSWREKLGVLCWLIVLAALVPVIVVLNNAEDIARWAAYWKFLFGR